MKFRKKWVILIAALAAAAVILWFLPDLFNQKIPQTAVSGQTEKTEAKAEEPAPEPETKDEPGKSAGAAADAVQDKDDAVQEQPFLVQVTDNDPSIAYVLVRMPNSIGLLPLPVEGEYTRTIRQNMPDGTEAVNVLHLTANGVWMEDANCEGHDCINEGKVTLENREERVLWNMIICLPHQLSLELITREEALQMTGKK